MPDLLSVACLPACLHRQTIKCLLIVPNPESALNEEAGRLLLHHYDDYCRRAKMMTEIHARSNCLMKEFANSCSSVTEGGGGANGRTEDSTDSDGPQAKKQRASLMQSSTCSTSSATSSSANPAAGAGKKAPSAAARDKRRTLKRL